MTRAPTAVDGATLRRWAVAGRDARHKRSREGVIRPKHPPATVGCTPDLHIAPQMNTLTRAYAATGRTPGWFRRRPSAKPSAGPASSDESSPPL